MNIKLLVLVIIRSFSPPDASLPFQQYSINLVRSPAPYHALSYKRTITLAISFSIPYTCFLISTLSTYLSADQLCYGPVLYCIDSMAFIGSSGSVIGILYSWVYFEYSSVSVTHQPSFIQSLLFWEGLSWSIIYKWLFRNEANAAILQKIHVPISPLDTCQTASWSNILT